MNSVRLIKERLPDFPANAPYDSEKMRRLIAVLQSVTYLPGSDSGGAASNSFSTIAVSGQSDVVADSATDTLTLVAGSNVTITTNAGADSVTISAASGASNSFGTVSVAGQSDVVADASADTLTLVAGTNITITTNAGSDAVTINSTASGTGDVTAAASLTDNVVVRGDGGVKGVQDSLFFIDDAGHQYTGYTLAVTFANSRVPLIQVHATSNTEMGIGVTTWSTTAGRAARFSGARSRGAAVGTQAVVLAGDSCATFAGEASDGAGFFGVGSFVVNVDNGVSVTASSGIVPGRASLRTSDLLGTLNDVLSADSLGAVRMHFSGNSSIPTLTWDVDADTGRYRIGSNAVAESAGGVDQYHWTANGFFIDRGLHQAITTITSTTTIDDSYCVVLCDTSAGSFTCNLANATGVGGTGLVLTFIKISSDANVVTIDGNGSQPINGALTKALSVQWESLTIHGNAATAAWYIR